MPKELNTWVFFLSGWSVNAKGFVTLYILFELLSMKVRFYKHVLGCLPLMHLCGKWSKANFTTKSIWKEAGNVISLCQGAVKFYYVDILICVNASLYTDLLC